MQVADIYDKNKKSKIFSKKLWIFVIFSILQNKGGVVYTLFQRAL